MKVVAMEYGMWKVHPGTTALSSIARHGNMETGTALVTDRQVHKQVAVGNTCLAFLVGSGPFVNCRVSFGKNSSLDERFYAR